MVGCSWSSFVLSMSTVLVHLCHANLMFMIQVRYGMHPVVGRVPQPCGRCSGLSLDICDVTNGAFNGCQMWETCMREGCVVLLLLSN